MQELAVLMGALLAVGVFFEDYARGRAHRWLDRVRSDAHEQAERNRLRVGAGALPSPQGSLREIFREPKTVIWSRRFTSTLALLNLAIFAVIVGDYIGTSAVPDPRDWDPALVAATSFLVMHLAMAVLVWWSYIELDRERLRLARSFGDDYVFEIATILLNSGAPDRRPGLHRLSDPRQVDGAPVDIIFSNHNEFFIARAAGPIARELKDLGWLTKQGMNDAAALSRLMDLLRAIELDWENQVDHNWQESYRRLEASYLSAGFVEQRASGYFQVVLHLANARLAEILLRQLVGLKDRWPNNAASAENLEGLRKIAAAAAMRAAFFMKADYPAPPTWVFPRSADAWTNDVTSYYAVKSGGRVGLLLARATENATDDERTHFLGLAIRRAFKSPEGYELTSAMAAMLLPQTKISVAHLARMVEREKSAADRLDSWFDSRVPIWLAVVLALRRDELKRKSRQLLVREASKWSPRCGSLCLAIFLGLTRFRLPWEDVLAMLHAGYSPGKDEKTVDEAQSILAFLSDAGTELSYEPVRHGFISHEEATVVNLRLMAYATSVGVAVMLLRDIWVDPPCAKQQAAFDRIAELLLSSPVVTSPVRRDVQEIRDTWQQA